MDVFNRQPSIAEDVVQYSIYPPPDISDKSSVTALAACITEFVDSSLPGFIWHRDPFEVKVVSNPDTVGSWILEGRMRVGDCIDDEWCAVWLLKEASSRWNIIVSFSDSDGQFLLIEAAEVLPSWVKPTNSENRVWIHNSRLHLIPLAYISPESTVRRQQKVSPNSDEEVGIEEENDDFIATVDALKHIRDPQIDTLAPPAIEKIVWDRISGYPLALKAHVHLTKAYIPRDIIRALIRSPLLVQKAVETFYTRDAIQLRAAHRMSRFPPNTSILASVRMTRTAYAQLSGQKFYPPKIFGQWKESEGSSEWKWKDTGMKIAIGFEMLYQENKNRQVSQDLSSDGAKALTDSIKDALSRDPEYQKYLKSLMAANYFKGELQGSKLWNEFEDRATLTFVQTRRTDDTSRHSFAYQVDAAVASTNELTEPLDQGEDSEEWLNLEAEDFDQLLESKAKRKDSNLMDLDRDETAGTTQDHVASEQAKRMKDLAAKVENFVEGEGDLEGARFEDDEFSDEFSDAESSDNDSDPGPSFSRSDKRTLEQQRAMDKLVPSLDPSEYGKMPSDYYAGSQRVAPEEVVTDNKGDVGSSKVSDEGEQPITNPSRPPIITRNKYDGVDSDDESDESDDDIGGDISEEEERPQVVGEIEIDMEEEQEEFINFSRQILGIDDSQWAEIVKDRKERGVFLPSGAAESIKSPTQTLPTVESPLDDPPWHKESGQPRSDPNLDSFEAVMKALDDVLLQKQTTKSNAPNVKPSVNDEKGKNKATIECAMEVDDNTDFNAEEMDEELGRLLESDELGSENSLDYNLIKNFLESFKSQGGLSGPVSNLAGRLAPDLKFPRDSST